MRSKSNLVYYKKNIDEGMKKTKRWLAEKVKNGLNEQNNFIDHILHDPVVKIKAKQDPLIVQTKPIELTEKENFYSVQRYTPDNLINIKI
jgi:hypothetical protein